MLFAWLAHAKAVTGSRADAVRLIARAQALGAERYVPPYHVALAYAGLDSLDAAFAALDQAWLDRDPALGNLAVEPRFASLRADPRFSAMVEKLGLGR